MGKAVVTFCNAGGLSYDRARMPTIRGTGSKAEVVTTGSSSVATTTIAAAPDTANASYGGYVQITAASGAVWVDFGTAPVAAVPSGSVGTGFGLMEGQTREFSIDTGHKVALINWVI